MSAHEKYDPNYLDVYKGELSIKNEMKQGKTKKKKKSNKQNTEEKDVYRRNEIQIILRSHPCLCTSITWDDQV